MGSYLSLRGRALALLCAPVVAVTAAVQLTHPLVAAAAPTVGTNINVSKAAGGQVEGSITVDPTNPQRLFLSANGGTYKYSADAGTTWTQTTTSFANVCCDTSSAFDGYGNLFLIFLDTGVFNTPKNGKVHVELSTDAGKSFTELTTLDNGNVDQPTVTVGTGSVWVTWRSGDKKIQASGASVSALGTVGTFSTPEEAGVGNFGDIAVSPSGAVMVTYQRPYGDANPSSIYVAVDADGLGPGGFAPEIKVTDTNVGGFYPIPAQQTRTIDAEANLAWDRSGGAHNGRVYLVYTDSPATGSSDTDIYVRFSDDAGATWSSRVKVNDDSTSNSQFLPAIAIDQTTGKLAVAWYDARNDAGTGGSGDTNNVANDDVQYWGATSDDGTSFSTNFRVSTGTSNCEKAQASTTVGCGDYTHAAYESGTFYPSWGDNSNSTGDNPNGALAGANVYTAAVVVAARSTSLTYTGATSGDDHDPVTLSATLRDSSHSTGINAQTLTFTVGSQSCQGTTNASGAASCTLTLDQPAASTTVTVTYAGSAQYSASSTSTGFTINREEDTLTYTGATTGDYHDAVTAAAVLLEDGNSSRPLAGRWVTFTLGGGGGTETCSGLTDVTGTASCSLTPTEAAGPTTVTATFAGDTGYLPASNSRPFTITTEETTLAYTGDRVIANGRPATMRGVLLEDGATGIAARSVSFTLGSGGSAQSCSGVTDTTGTASCTISSVNQPLGPGTVSARFAGDAYYRPSSDSASTVLFSFLPGGGGFTAGDGSSAVGTTASWWGADWAQSNTLSGGPAPDSYKGFARTPSSSPPACGGTWTSRPGNSSGPPASVPSYMAVLVASSVTKSGPTLRGDIVHIVVVRTDPGYGGNPGHPGTGTVVAVYC